MPKTYGIGYRVQLIFYLISVVFSILSTVLSIIDKEEIDDFIITDIVLGSLLILILTFGVSFLERDMLGIFLGVTGVLWLANSVMGFFTYMNPKRKDFLGVCVFLRIMRILSVFAYIMTTAIKIDEEDW